MQEMHMNRVIAMAAAALVAVAAAAQPAQSEGQVVKIDKAAQRVTLKHSGVPQLDMPAMTMAFRVANPKLLDDLAVGDKVSFAADKVGGSYTLLSLTKAR
jgi:Cu(I)/Ag(I) efflux system periplasmic protein CusF